MAQFSSSMPGNSTSPVGSNENQVFTQSSSVRNSSVMIDSGQSSSILSTVRFQDLFYFHRRPSHNFVFICYENLISDHLVISKVQQH
jgi:hypothetical protein